MFERHKKVKIYDGRQKVCFVLQMQPKEKENQGDKQHALFGTMT